MTQRVAPAYVPTLTEVVQSPMPGPAAVSPETPATAAATDPEQIVARVLARVEQDLERRLREAVAAVVQEQTRQLVPALLDEIEAVVRQTVTRALEDEARSAVRG